MPSLAKSPLAAVHGRCMHYPRREAMRDRRSVEFEAEATHRCSPRCGTSARRSTGCSPGGITIGANDCHWNGYDLRGSEHQQPVGARIQPRLLGWFFSRLAGSTGQIRGRAMPGASEVRRGSKAAPMLGGFGWRAVAGRRMVPLSVPPRRWVAGSGRSGQGQRGTRQSNTSSQASWRSGRSAAWPGMRRQSASAHPVPLPDWPHLLRA